MTPRQVRRILARYNTEGAAGLAHKSRGRISNRAVAQERKDRAIELVKKHYPDFGPTLAHEKLMEKHGVEFGLGTLRNEMIIQGLWKPKKRKLNSIHPYRQRRACIRELVQLEGISSKQEGTRYLREVYIPKHNKKFAVPPREPANLHRPLLPEDDLARISTVQECPLSA